MEFSNISSLIIYLAVFSCSARLFKKSTEKKYSKKFRFVCFIFSILLPSLLAGLRYNVGTDYPTYDEIFTSIRDNPLGPLSLTNWLEPGFRVIVKILSSVGNNQFVFGGIAFLTIIFFEIGLAHWQDKLDVGLAMFIYYLCFFYISFNAVRQLLAVSIIFLALQYINSSKLKAFLLIIVASLIHTASLAALPLIFLWNSKKNEINRTVLHIYMVCLILGVLLFPVVLTPITNLIGRYQDYQIAFQSNRDFYIKFLFLIVIIFFYRYIKNYDEIVELNMYIYIFSIIIGFLGFFVQYVKRLAYPYEMCVCIVLSVIPEIYYSERLKKIICKFLIILGITMYFILSTYITGGQQIFPYSIRW